MNGSARIRERGSVTLHGVVGVIAILLVVGLVVDGSARLHALERATSIAREAARQAGQMVDVADGSGAVSLNADSARWLGQVYLDQAGCSGGTIAVRGDLITATCTWVYTPVFLPGTAAATGSGTAQALRVG
jgi:hypothetical protein